MKHTPGEWYAVYLDNEEYVIEHDEREAKIATINDAPESARSVEENEANARLIAAAPEQQKASILLYDLLKRVANILSVPAFGLIRDDWNIAMNAHEKAIKKATVE